MENDDFGRTPIFYMIVEKRIEDFEMELEHLDDINAQDINGMTLLHFAADYHQTQMAQRLIQKGIDIGLHDKYGNTALWKAVFNARGTYDLVQLLMKNGANPAPKNKAGKSPIDFAETIGDKYLIGILNKKNTL